MKKLIIGASIVALFVSVAVVNGQALAEDVPAGAVVVTATPTPTPTSTPNPFPTPTDNVCPVISNSMAQLYRTREQWENECYSNPYTDEEMVHEPTAIDLTHPSYDASSEVWSDWYMARVAHCGVLKSDYEYIDCMYRPWIYGF